MEFTTPIPSNDLRSLLSKKVEYGEPPSWILNMKSVCKFDPDNFNLKQVLKSYWHRPVSMSCYNVGLPFSSRRFRRKPKQVLRLFDCDFEGCDKSYGTISHLNTHRTRKNHGDARRKNDFH